MHQGIPFWRGRPLKECQEQRYGRYGSLRLEKIKENRKTPVFFWNFYNLGLVFSNVLCYNSKRCYVRVTEK